MPALKKLATCLPDRQAGNWQLAGVVTAPDKPLGRKQVLTPSPVKSAALGIGVQALTPATLKDDNFFETFKNLKPDICIVVAYGKLIPQRYLNVPRFGFVNVHPSLLPKYRGPSPIQSAILNGDTETGVSIMLLDAEIDHGPVLAVSSFQLPANSTFSEIERDLAELGANLLIKTLMNLIPQRGFSQGGRPENKTLGQQAEIVVPSRGMGFISKEQNHELATFTKKFTREDGRIDWTQPATAIYNRIRALSENPGTWTTWQGKVLNIFKSETKNEKRKEKPGTVIRMDNGIGVVCGSDVLVLENIQLEGGKPMDCKSFLHGHFDFIGAILG